MQGARVVPAGQEWRAGARVVCGGKSGARALGAWAVGRPCRNLSCDGDVDGGGGCTLQQQLFPGESPTARILLSHTLSGISCPPPSCIIFLIRSTCTSTGRGWPGSENFRCRNRDVHTNLKNTSNLCRPRGVRKSSLLGGHSAAVSTFASR